MRQLPASSECSHEKHDGPKVLRLDPVAEFPWLVVAACNFVSALHFTH